MTPTEIMSALAQSHINITDGLTTIEPGSRVHKALIALCTKAFKGHVEIDGQRFNANGQWATGVHGPSGSSEGAEAAPSPAPVTMEVCPRCCKPAENVGPWDDPGPWDRLCGRCKAVLALPGLAERLLGY